MICRNSSCPICDGATCYSDPAVQQLGQMIGEANGILVATPVYNYDVSASAKNLLELTGRVWTEKIVGFLCAAGGQGSYMSVMGLANSLMLDFRSLILPRFVYVDGSAFDAQDQITDEEASQRIANLADDLVRVTSALYG